MKPHVRTSISPSIAVVTKQLLKCTVKQRNKMSTWLVSSQELDFYKLNLINFVVYFTIILFLQKWRPTLKYPWKNVKLLLLRVTSSLASTYLGHDCVLRSSLSVTVFVENGTEFLIEESYCTLLCPPSHSYSWVALFWRRGWRKADDHFWRAYTSDW